MEAEACSVSLSEASPNSGKSEQAEQLKQQFHKRKQWTGEHKLEFIDLCKKYKNKASTVIPGFYCS